MIVDDIEENHVTVGPHQYEDFVFFGIKIGYNDIKQATDNCMLCKLSDYKESMLIEFVKIM